MSRLMAAILLLLAAVSGQALLPGKGLAQSKPSDTPKAGSVQPSETANRIAALKTKGGSDEWDIEVERILLGAFDTDNSGEIDTDGELAAIPCDVWQALDKSIRAGGGKDSSLIATYGFDRGTWDGDSLGFDEQLRKSALARIKACGL